MTECCAMIWAGISVSVQRRQQTGLAVPAVPAVLVLVGGDSESNVLD